MLSELIIYVYQVTRRKGPGQKGPGQMGPEKRARQNGPGQKCPDKRAYYKWTLDKWARNKRARIKMLRTVAYRGKKPPRRGVVRYAAQSALAIIFLDNS